MYQNSRTPIYTADGNTKSDKALAIWNSMTPVQRLEIMQQVSVYKQIARKHRACINLIAETMVPNE